MAVRKTVVGVFEDRMQAERAVDALKNAGFRDDQIGFVWKDERDVDGETMASGNMPGGEESGHTGGHVAKGAVVGGIIGAAAALLIPGIGPAIAGGILAPVLAGGAAATGAAVAGAAVGGVLGGLVSLGIPDEEAHYYEGEFQSGRALVTVRVDAGNTQASSILRQYGAYDINNRQHDRMGGISGDSTGLANQNVYENRNRERDLSGTLASGERGRITDEETRRLDLHEEQLNVSKQRVQSGEVQVRKEVVTEEKTINVPVTREEVVIERRAASGEPSDTPIGEGETIRVPISEEKVDVTKQSVKTGEVNVGKRKIEDNVEVKDDVRREELKVDKEGDVRATTDRPMDRTRDQERYDRP